MRPFYPRACPVIRIDAIWLATEPMGMRDDTETAPVQIALSNRRSYLKANNLVASMSGRGNCHDNAVAESVSSC